MGSNSCSENRIERHRTSKRDSPPDLGNPCVRRCRDTPRARPLARIAKLRPARRDHTVLWSAVPVPVLAHPSTCCPGGNLCQSILCRKVWGVQPRLERQAAGNLQGFLLPTGRSALSGAPHRPSEARPARGNLERSRASGPLLLEDRGAGLITSRSQPGAVAETKASRRVRKAMPDSAWRTDSACRPWCEEGVHDTPRTRLDGSAARNA